MKLSSNTYLKKIKEDDRIKKMAINTFTSFFSKGINLIVTIVSVPLLLEHLGNERYGMFALVSSILGVLNFGDLGLSLGLQNKLPSYLINKDETKARMAISSTFFILLLVSLLLLLTSFIIVWVFDWPNFFKVKSEVASLESKYVALAFFLCFFIGMPFSLGSTILTGLQKNFIGEIFKSVGNIVLIIFLYLAVLFNMNTVFLTYIMYGHAAIIGVIISWYVFYKYEPKWRPTLKNLNLALAKSLVGDSSRYFILQLFSLGLLTVDGFFVAQYEGSESVSTFMIGIRLVSIITLPAVLINSQLLPAINDAIAKNELDWIKKNIKRVFIFNSFYAIIFLLLILFIGNFILYKWVGSMISFTNLQWLGFSFFFIFSLYNSVISAIMLSPVFLKFSTFIFPISIILMVIAKWFFISAHNSAMMLIMGSMVMILFYFIPSLIKIKKVFYHKKVVL